MKTSRFDRIVKARLKEITKTIVEKGAEYARVDRLHNFNRLSELQRQCKEKSLLHLCDKQYISLHDLADDIQEGEPMASLDLWREKVGDVIVYMILLEAMAVEAEESK
jgi:hypothetical protein